MPARIPRVDPGCSLFSFPGTTHETDGSVPAEAARMKSSWSRMRSCCPVSYIVVKPGSGFFPEAVCPPDPGVEHGGNEHVPGAT